MATGTAEPYDIRDVNCQPHRWTLGRGFPISYSPGVCPDLHTVAETTGYSVSGDQSVGTHYKASCCRRSVYVLLSVYR
jgi:hypothetical protein